MRTSVFFAHWLYERWSMEKSIIGIIITGHERIPVQNELCYSINVSTVSTVKSVITVNERIHLLKRIMLYYKCICH